MVPTLRTIALLMLLAGASLGVFAGALLADREGAQPASLDDKVEARLSTYDDIYDLTGEEKRQLRQILRWHRREVASEVRRLYQENLERFEAINDRAQSRIDAVLGGRADPQED